jgi:Putative salt-induced outer membrane protein
MFPSPKNWPAWMVLVACYSVSMQAVADEPKARHLVVSKSAFAKKLEWSGTVGLGLSGSSGTSQVLNLNTDDALHWHRALWSNQSRLLYNYSTSQGEVSADRLDVSNETRYDIALHQYLFANVNYHRNRFDGYYFRADETMGYGRFFVLSQLSHLRLEAGAGVRQANTVDGVHSIHPVARFYSKYLWEFSPHAHLSEVVDAILVNNGANTYHSVFTVVSPLYGPLNLRITFIATYNANVKPSYKPMNTLTTINLAYNF